MASERGTLLKIRKLLNPPAVIAALLMCNAQLAVCNSACAAIAPVVTQQLSDGATLITRSDKIAPRVAISLLIRAGAADETVQNAGWRQVLTGALLRATMLEDGKVRTANEWQRLAQSWGGEFGASSGEDFIELWARGDSAYAPQLLEALVQIASAPRLSDADIAWARRRALEIVGQPTSGVEQRAADAIAHALYHDANGAPLAYALPDYGTFDSLSELSNEALRALHANYFRSARFVVSAAGDVNRDALKEVLDKSRSGETTMGAVAPLVETAPTFAAIPVDAPPLKVKEAQAQGAWIFVAWRTPALSTLPPADTAALRVLSAALADSSRARLQGRLVREKSVMERRNKTRAAEVALQVAAQWTPRRWAGELVLMAQCDTQNMDTVKNALLDEVHRLRTAPLTPLELQAAKNYVRGEWALQHEQPRERAFQGALPAIWNSFADTDWPQYIATVTSEDIRRVTQKYLQAYAVVLILPQP